MSSVAGNPTDFDTSPGGNPLEMEVLMRTSSINGELSSEPCLVAGGYFVVGEPSTDQVHFGILRNDMAVGSFCLALQTSPLHSDLTEQHQHHCKFCLVIKGNHPRMTKHFRLVSYKLPMSIYIDQGWKESKHN